MVSDYLTWVDTFNPLSAILQMTKNYVCKISKHVSSKLYHIENSKAIEGKLKRLIKLYPSASDKKG